MNAREVILDRPRIVLLVENVLTIGTESFKKREVCILYSLTVKINNTKLHILEIIIVDYSFF